MMWRTDCAMLGDKQIRALTVLSAFVVWLLSGSGVEAALSDAAGKGDVWKLLTLPVSYTHLTLPTNREV